MAPGDPELENSLAAARRDPRGRTSLDPTAILAALSSLSADVILLLTPDGVITSCSEAITDVLGWAPEDLIGQAHNALLHPADRASTDAWASYTACQMRHRDGSNRWIEPATTAIRDPDGSVAGHVALWRDVTDRIDADRRFAASEAQLTLLAENIHDVVLMADADCTVTYCSPSITDLLGWEPADLVGRPSTYLMLPEDHATLIEGFTPVEPRGEALAAARMRHKDGSYRWVESAGRTVLSPGGETLGYTATWRDISDRVVIEAELERRARVDYLTGLATRSEIIDEIHRIGAAPAAVAVLFCDIDRFKEFNDRYGHAAGDAVLRTVGERITETIRVGDRVARFGGDEMLVVLKDVRTLDHAVAVAEKIRTTASQPVDLDAGTTVSPTLSIGVTMLDAGDSEDSVIARADNAMYEAKASGRNRVVASGTSTPVRVDPTTTIPET